MLRFPKSPTTLTQALALADETLAGASRLKLDAVLFGTFASKTERAEHLAELGGIVAANADLEHITPALVLLRKQCRKAKPTAKHYAEVQELLKHEASPLKAITCDVLNNLPYLATVVAEDHATTLFMPDEAFPKRDRDLHPRRLTTTETCQIVTNARERATAAKTLLEGLPAILARVRELAEGSGDLSQISPLLD